MILWVGQNDSHAVVVPVGAVGVLVEGLRRDAGVYQAGQQPREVVCGVLLAQVPAATPFIGTRLCNGSSREIQNQLKVPCTGECRPKALLKRPLTVPAQSPAEVPV